MAEWASIDLESRSTVDLRKSGVYPYAQHPDTDVWLACWALDDGPVHCWFPGQPVPPELAAHIAAGGKLRAWNAQFERVMTQHILGPRHGWPVPAPEQWWCTAAQAAAMSLPRALDDAAGALNMPVRKDKEGQALMMRMARPRKINEDGSLVWWDEPARIERLASYCVRDVEVERAIAGQLRQLPEAERAVYMLDQRINDRGVLLDLPLIHSAQSVAEQAVKRLNERLRQVTGGRVDAATKAKNLTIWLREQGLEADSVNKQAVHAMLKQDDLLDAARTALEIRKEAAKASTAKLKSMLTAVCRDSRVRGLLLYHGAGTGRWAGKLVQPQNFPKGTVVNAEQAIPLIMDGDIEILEVLFGPPLDVVSSNLRGCMVASPGHDLIAVDFSAIEARGVAWLAGETDLLHLFATGGDTYIHMATAIFGRQISKADKVERFVGKQTVLGCGYGMGWKKFIDHCNRLAAELGLEITVDDELAQRAVRAYREQNTRIVALWREMDEAAVQAVSSPGLITSAARGRVRFRVKSGFLWMVLPSGRALAYAAPRVVKRCWIELSDGTTRNIRVDQLDAQRRTAEAEGLTITKIGDPQSSVVFMGVDSQSRKWGMVDTYGGLWTENAVQALSRDLLAAAMLRLEAAGYRIVLTVHDEVVCEVPEGKGSVEEVEHIMCQLTDWAAGLPVAAEGWRNRRYRK